MEQIQKFLDKMSARVSFRGIVAVLVITLSFGYLYIDRLWGKTEREGSDVKIALISLITFILGYYFGASKDKSDQEKNRAAGELIDKQKESEDAKSS